MEPVFFVFPQQDTTLQAANQKNNLYYPETSKSVFHEPRFLPLVAGGLIYGVPGDINVKWMWMYPQNVSHP